MARILTGSAAPTLPNRVDERKPTASTRNMDILDKPETAVFEMTANTRSSLQFWPSRFAPGSEVYDVSASPMPF
jgi:hypothetical protein